MLIIFCFYDYLEGLIVALALMFKLKGGMMDGLMMGLKLLITYVVMPELLAELWFVGEIEAWKIEDYKDK